MATEFDDLSQIRHVRTGDPVAEKPTSQPTRAIERRLKILEDRLIAVSAVTELTRLVIRNVPIKTGENAVTLDDVVYYNATSGLFEKAVAGVTFTEGLFQFNSSALAIGICINVGNGVGDIMIAGSTPWRDGNHKETMIESIEDFVPGIPYFLSDNEPGKLTRYPPSLRIQLLIATDTHYVLLPAYSQPEAVENLTKVPVGMRAVGGVRLVPPAYEHAVIVAFDGLEKYDTTTLFNQWRPTTESDVALIKNFGFMVADISLDQTPDASLFIRISVATNGTIKAFSADTLAELYAASSSRFNEVTSFLSLSANEDTIRNYSVKDANDVVLGTLAFKFVSDDHSVQRDVIFKFPDSFQGWKMVNAPITPLAVPVVTAGAITTIKVQEPGIGYKTPPAVVIEGSNTTPALATAVLDQFGSVSEVIIDDEGDGYTTPTVRFDTRVTGVKIENGGKNAVVTATQSGGVINSVTISDAGEGYWSLPAAIVTDPDGNGAILQVETINGKISKVAIMDGGSGYTDPRVVVKPNTNSGYRKTKAGSFTAVLTADAVTSITVGSGGLGYLTGAQVRITPGPATADVIVNSSGTVTGFTITSGGSGYSSPPTVTVDLADPILLIDGGTPDTPAVGTLDVQGMVVDRIDILSTGYAYDAAVAIAASGGLGVGGSAALFAPILDGDGRITDVRVLYPGKIYESPPSLVLTATGDGNGFTYRVVMSSHVAAGTITDPGDNYSAVPQAYVGAPVLKVEVDSGGSGYDSAPTVTIDPPQITFDEQVTATADAFLGGQLKTVKIVSGGADYLPADTFAVTGGGGSGALIKVSLDADGTVLQVDILDPGYGYTSAPSITITTGTGSGAAFAVTIEGVGSVVKVVMTKHGHGYVGRPKITFAGGTPTTGALATAKLMGERSVITPIIAGDGGLRKVQEAVATTGNLLQIKDFNDDMEDLASAPSVKPVGGVFYYNTKADAGLKSRYPAVPVSKAMFSMNGTDLTVTDHNAASGLMTDPFADVLLTEKTIVWTTMDADGCPWDREARPFILDLGAGGQDHIIPDSGPIVDNSNPYKDAWWRWWDHLFKYEPLRNKAWLHLNKPSRFHQSSKVSSLGVMSPLRMFDILSGVEAKNDGTPMVGQLLLTLDNQANILGGTLAQINTTDVNNIVAIYVNTTGRMVMVSSIILQCTFHKSSLAVAPTVADAALVTIGTLEGNYRDLVGTLDPEATTQVGRSCCLYGLNQVKELFPDDRESAPLLMPGQPIYLRVDNPVSSAIISQSILAKVKGHVL